MDSLKSNIFDQEDSLEASQNLNTNEVNIFNKEQDNEVPRYSPEWRQVEFHLKSSLMAHASINSIELLHNQHMITNFNKQTANKISSFAWINESYLGENNHTDKLIARGFEIDNTGLEFCIGCPISSKEVDLSRETDCTFIFCKILIGKSYYEKNKESSRKNHRKKGHFDSYLVYSEDSNKENKYSRGALSRYTYKIHNSANVLPLYKVNFSVILNHSHSQVPCSACTEEFSSRYCIDCDSAFCFNCDKKVHETYAKMLGAKHRVEDLKVSRNGKCYFCQLNEAKKYCNKCEAAICLTCLASGSHSLGEMKMHPIEDLQEKKNACNPENSNWEPFSAIKKNLDSLESFKSKVTMCIK